MTDAGPLAANGLVLRRAAPDDVELLFEWRNLPQIVDLSTSRRRVDWDEHRAWLTGLLADANRLLLVILSGHQPIGQVRFDPLPAARRDARTISVYLVPGHTGRGLGVPALRAASAMAFDLLRVRRIYAFIRQDNARSVRAFEKAGYRDPSPRTRSSHPRATSPACSPTRDRGETAMRARPARVLIVAAHADDETLGCGGTARRYADEGAAVSVVFLADGVSSRAGLSSGEREAEMEARELHARQAAEILGCMVLSFHRLPDNRLDTVALLDVIRCVERAKMQVTPDVVLTHHPGDLNVDHRVVSAATCTAFRPCPGETWQEVRAFEVPTATDWGGALAGASFVPDTYVDVSATIGAKLDAYACYGDEVPGDPHGRSRMAVESLARTRGRQAGVAAAEAFTTLRRILR